MSREHESFAHYRPFPKDILSEVNNKGFLYSLSSEVVEVRGLCLSVRVPRLRWGLLSRGRTVSRETVLF